MSVNKYKPHLFIIPEDDADRQIAVGFELRGNIKARSLQIVNTAGGWLKVIDLIEKEYIPILKKYPKSQVLGIIDCDNHPERIRESLHRFPEEFRDRIFLIGTLKDPQELKKNVNLSFERIGEDLAEECYSGNPDIWNDEQLSHLADELIRVAEAVKPTIFGTLE